MRNETKAGALLQERPSAKRQAKKLPPQDRHEAPKGRKPRNLEVDEKYVKVFDSIVLANAGDPEAERLVDGYLQDVDPIDIGSVGSKKHSLLILAHDLAGRNREAAAGSDPVAEYFGNWGPRLYRCVSSRVVSLAIMRLAIKFPSIEFREQFYGVKASGKSLSQGPPTREDMRNRRQLLMLQIIAEVENLQRAGVDPFID
jgi:hypothetical protein